MNNLKKDIGVAVLFVGGTFSFISGSFIISTVAFAIAAVFSNLQNNEAV
jgi:hypothetical protein